MTPVKTKKNISKVVGDSLKSFPGPLSESDAALRVSLLALIEEDPKSVSNWRNFLSNEKKLMEKAGHPVSLLVSRVKLARNYLSTFAVDLLGVEMMASASERRSEYEMMQRKGVISSSLFLSWSEMEVAEGAPNDAVSVLENGLKVVSPSSPGHERIAKMLDDMRASVTAVAPPPEQKSPMIAPMDESVTGAKSKGRIRPKRLLGGGAARAARVKPSEQKVEEEPKVTEVDDAKHEEPQEDLPRNRKVKFASPNQAPAGPRSSLQRQGSMSPVVVPSVFIPNMVGTSSRASLSSGTESSPKRSDDSFLQTPMPVVHNRKLSFGTTPGRPGTVATHNNNNNQQQQQQQQQQHHNAINEINVASSAVTNKMSLPRTEARGHDDLATPSRVLFKTDVKAMRQAEEELATPAVAQFVQPVHVAAPPVVVAAAPAAAAPPPQQQKDSQEQAENGYKAGEKVQVGKRRLKILEVLGEGGYSKVYKVLDRDSFELFAMKDVEQNAVDKTFGNEVRILTRLSRLSSMDSSVRNRVVQVKGFEENSLRSVLLLELGELDLTRALMRARSYRKGMVPIMDVTELRYYWKQMLKCISVLHEHGIVHCDLKPANFVVFQGRLKVIDFGIAVESSQPEPQTKGTLNYLPPELCARLLEKEKKFEPPLPARDVWALGCILYELAFERPPFKGNGKEQPHVIMRNIANPTHAVSYPECGYPSLQQCISACLRYLPEMRPSVNALLEHKFLHQNET